MDPSPPSTSAPVAPATGRKGGRGWRAFFLVLGYVCVTLAAVGVFLPVLPTTPFLLLAVAAYMRSHPEKAERLLRHPRFGPYLRDWREQGAIPTRAKILSVVMMTLGWVLLLATTSHPATPIVVGVVLVCTALFIVTRPVPKR